MSTLGEVMSRFRSKVGDNDGKFFSDDELIWAINQFIEDVSDESRHVRKLATLNAIMGVSFVQMPADCIEMLALPMWQGEPLRKIDNLYAQGSYSKDWDTLAGTPTRYYRDSAGEGYLQLFRKPTETLPIFTADAAPLDGSTDPAVIVFDSDTSADYVAYVADNPGVEIYLACWDGDTYENPYEDPKFEILELDTADLVGNVSVARAALGTTIADHSAYATDAWFSAVVVDAVTFRYIAEATAVSASDDELNIPFRSERALLHRLSVDYYEKEGPRRNMDMVKYHLAMLEKEMANVVGRQARTFDRLPETTDNAMSEYM